MSRSASREAEYRACAELGMTRREAAAALGVTISAVNSAAFRYHIGFRRSDVVSARMRALNADPEFAARHRARMRALNADPEFAARHRARMKALNADPEFAARRSARMKALHADPEFAARQSARLRESSPLSRLTAPQRADYDVLKRAGYTRPDALRAIGRADLVEVPR